MSLKYCLSALVVSMSITGCGTSELLDEEMVTGLGDAVATIASAAKCGTTTLSRDSTVRSGSGSWEPWGELPAGVVVRHLCARDGKVKPRVNPNNGYNYVNIENRSGGPITYGWVLERNVN